MSEEAVVVQKSSGNGMFKAVVAVVVLVGGYFAVRSYMRERDKQNASGRLQESIPTQQATELRNAMQAQWSRPGTWLASDVSTIMNIAGRITNFQAVVEEYKSQYSRNLVDDLTAQLTPEQFKQFNSLLKVKNRPQTERTFIDRNINTALKKGDSVFLNWTDKTSITLFKNAEDYPVKMLTRIAKPAKPSTKPFGKVLQVDRINYKTGNVTALLAWVQIATGQKYWIRIADLKK